MKVLFSILSLCAPLTGQSLSWDLEARLTSWPSQEETRFKNTTPRGTISINSNLLMGNGKQIISFSREEPNFEFSLSFEVSLYDAKSDPSSLYPKLTFIDQELIGVDFAIYLNPNRYKAGAFLQLHPDGSLNYSPNGVNEFEGRYSIAPLNIPEPDTSLLILLSTFLTLAHKRK